MDTILSGIQIALNLLEDLSMVPLRLHLPPPHNNDSLSYQPSTSLRDAQVLLRLRQRHITNKSLSLVGACSLYAGEDFYTSHGTDVIQYRWSRTQSVPDSNRTSQCRSPCAASTFSATA